MSSHRTQVLAWYSWPAAVEVFGVVGTGVLLPMMMEGIARSVGSWGSDHSISCVLGRWINTNSFAMYTRSAATICAVIMILAMGTLADDPAWRKKLLAMSVYIGAFAAMAFYFTPEHPSTSFPLVAAGITTVCVTSYIYGTICANGYLPILARRSADLSEPVVPSSEDIARRDPSPYAHRSSRTSERRPLLERKEAPDTSLITSRMSSQGMACGIIVAMVVQYFAKVALTRGLRMTTLFGACGTWYAIAVIPSIIFLPGRKDLELEKQRNHARDEEGRLNGRQSAGSHAGPSEDNPRSMGKMINVLKSIKNMPNLRNLLFNWVIASDVLHVLPTTCILQATTELGFTPADVMSLAMTAMFAAGISAVSIPRIQRLLGVTNLQILTWSIVHVLGYLAFGASSVVNRDWGYHTKTSVYVLLVYLGVGYGGYYSYARAIYAEMIPPGQESSFFSLFALTDRSASFSGPLIVAVITQSTGRFDYAWLALLVLMVLSLPMLGFVDVDEGRVQGQMHGKGRETGDEIDE